MYQRYINPLSTLDPGIAERDVAPAPFRKTSFSGLVEEVAAAHNNNNNNNSNASLNLH